MTEFSHATDPSLMAGSTPVPVKGRVEQLDMDLLSQRSVTLDINGSPVYPASEIGLAPQAGEYEVRVMAELALPGHEDMSQDAHMAVLQIANTKGEVRYALQGLAVDEQGKAVATRTQVVAIKPDGKTVVGLIGDDKNHQDSQTNFVSAGSLWGKDATYSRDVSPVHLELLPNSQGGLNINDTSKTGTGILRNKQNIAESHTNPHISAAYRLGIEKGIIKDGKFAGRPIIDSYSTVGGSNEPKVDIASWGAGGEAIVVGASRESEKKAYEDLKSSFQIKIAETEKWSGQKPSEIEVLKDIASTVSDKLEYDLPFVNDVTERLSKLEPIARKVNLSYYLDEGKGVCRHMSWAAAWLGSEAKAAGLLEGKTVVQGNQRRTDNAAHQWARYRTKDGSIWIIDPTRETGKQVMRIEDALADKESWYLEEAERTSLQRRAQTMGNLIITNIPDQLFDQEIE